MQTRHPSGQHFTATYDLPRACPPDTLWWPETQRCVLVRGQHRALLPLHHPRCLFLCSARCFVSVRDWSSDCYRQSIRFCPAGLRRLPCRPVRGAGSRRDGRLCRPGDCRSHHQVSSHRVTSSGSMHVSLHPIAASLHWGALHPEESHVYLSCSRSALLVLESLPCRLLVW